MDAPALKRSSAPRRAHATGTGVVYVLGRGPRHTSAPVITRFTGRSRFMVNGSRSGFAPLPVICREQLRPTDRFHTSTVICYQKTDFPI